MLSQHKFSSMLGMLLILTSVTLGLTNLSGIVNIDNNIILNEGGGATSAGPDIRFTRSGMIASEDYLFINVDSDNDGSGELQIGEKSNTSNAKKLVTVGSASVPASDHVNGGAPDTTLTRVRLVGDNSFSDIFHYSGTDITAGHSGYREELSLMGHEICVGRRDHDSAGLHIYGNNDTQHGGWVGFFTGGLARFAIDPSGRVGVGSRNVMIDHRNYFVGRFNIIDPLGEPGLYIEGASSQEGDIAWKDGENLQLGTWKSDSKYVDYKSKNTGQFTALVTITSAGVLSIDNPREGKQGYIKLDTLNTNSPNPADCMASPHYGRMIVDASKGILYICTAKGWLGK